MARPPLVMRFTHSTAAAGGDHPPRLRTTSSGEDDGAVEADWAPTDGWEAGGVAAASLAKSDESEAHHGPLGEGVSKSTIFARREKSGDLDPDCSVIVCHYR